MSPRRAERGVTLTELLVVVAIIGVLVSVASVSMSAKPKTIDIANQLGDLVREANRRAVALGPVRTSVALAIGSKARTRIVATGTAQPTFTLQRLQENAPPSTAASWIDVASVTIDKVATADSYGNSVGSYAALTRSTTWSGFVANCYPDGKCDPRTIFLRATKATGTFDTYAKLAIMPIGGAVMTRRDWN
jgi:prepilin-type N-terminal cleavage/methylation domain-containing protein